MFLFLVIGALQIWWWWWWSCSWLQHCYRETSWSCYTSFVKSDWIVSCRCPSPHKVISYFRIFRIECLGTGSITFTVTTISLNWRSATLTGVVNFMKTPLQLAALRSKELHVINPEVLADNTHNAVATGSRVRVVIDPQNSAATVTATT